MVEYTVQEGDSLYLIAEKILGDGNRWPEIYAANAEVIGSNPDIIFPNQVLVVGTIEEEPMRLPWGLLVGLAGVGGLLYYKGVF